MTKVLRFRFFEGGKVGAEDPVGWSGRDVPEDEIREGNDLAEALDETREFVSGLDMGHGTTVLRRLKILAWVQYGVSTS